MKKTLFTIASTFIATTSGWAESGPVVSAHQNTNEVAQCASHIDEPNGASVYGYDIAVTNQLLKIAALRSDGTIDDALIQPLAATHWTTEPTGQLLHSCFDENTNHDTLEIQVFEDVVIVQRTSLAGLHSPQVFEILRPILKPEPHSRFNETGFDSSTESTQEFDFEKKVRHYIEYGEPFSPEVLVSLKDQLKRLAQSQCRSIGVAHQIGDFRTRSGHQPYVGKYVDVSGRFTCVRGESGSAMFH